MWPRFRLARGRANPQMSSQRHDHGGGRHRIQPISATASSRRGQLTEHSIAGIPSRCFLAFLRYGRLIVAWAPKELDVLEVSIDELATAITMRRVARSRLQGAMTEGCELRYSRPRRCRIC
jgi:hypothetical protein